MNCVCFSNRCACSIACIWDRPSRNTHRFSHFLRHGPSSLCTFLLKCDHVIDAQCSSLTHHKMLEHACLPHSRTGSNLKSAPQTPSLFIICSAGPSFLSKVISSNILSALVLPFLPSFEERAAICGLFIFSSCRDPTQGCLFKTWTLVGRSSLGQNIPNIPKSF